MGQIIEAFVWTSDGKISLGFYSGKDSSGTRVFEREIAKAAIIDEMDIEMVLEELCSGGVPRDMFKVIEVDVETEKGIYEE